MDLKEIGRKDMDLIYLAQDRVQWPGFVDTVMNLPVTKKKAENNLTS
jgi:hypothetical protein